MHMFSESDAIVLPRFLEYFVLALEVQCIHRLIRYARYACYPGVVIVSIWYLPEGIQLCQVTWWSAYGVPGNTGTCTMYRNNQGTYRIY